MATMAQAIRMALHYSETHLDLKDIFGQDVGPPMGGVFTATQGLKNSWNSPLDERGIIGMATGIALAGERCVAEIQFCDYIFNTIDLLKIVGNTHWVSNGNYNLPLVVMTPVGSGIRGSIYHSHSFDSWATRLAGWKVVTPSNAFDAYGLLLAAVKDPNPVLYLPPKNLMRTRGKRLLPGEPENERELKAMIDAPLGDRSKWAAKWPDLGDPDITIGKASLVREGTRATIVSYGSTFKMVQTVVDEFIAKGIDLDLIDLRSLYPYDWSAIKTSLIKTRRILFVNEDTEVTNFCEHLSQRVISEFFYELDAKPRVLSGKQLPGIGLHPNLEEASVPQNGDVRAEIEALLSEEP